MAGEPKQNDSGGAKPRRKEVTIKEIARQAKVSIATVSRVINKTDHPVNAKTRKRVEAAIQKLQYSTNIYGKGLAGRSNVIGLCIGAPLSTDPGFAMSVARTIDGIKSVASIDGYHVFLEIDDTPRETEAAHRFFAGVPLAGVMLVAPRRDNPIVDYLKERRIPLIIVGSRAYEDTHYVDADNVDGGRQAVEYLAGLGRSRIGCLGGPSNFAPSVDMSRGFREQLRKLGLPQKRGWYARPAWTVEGGRDAALKMLSTDEPPDAVFAFTDFLALGAVQAAQELGIRVPEDLSVVGYDDFAIATAIHPQLSTFHHPDREMAAKATEWLLERIIPGKCDDDGLCQGLIKPRLVIRESCGGANTRTATALAESHG